MGHKIVLGPYERGLRTDRTAFAIDQEAFPTLINAYQWRGRIKRKRGTATLNRLQRFLGKTDGFGNATIFITPIPIGVGLITVTVGSIIYTDQGLPGPFVSLLTNSLTASANLNRTTGELDIFNAPANTAILYYPSLAVMGLEDLNLTETQFPGTLAFDTTYSYNISTSSPYPIYDVSFYKNPPADPINLPGYVPKATLTPTWWNGQNYQQFWTTNYANALWATNGINVPFNITNVGMQFAPSGTITYNSNTATTINLTITNCPLVVGDFVFFNEWTGANSATLNFQSGYVTTASGGNPNTVVITLPFANLGAGPYTPGIVQYLTNRSDTTKDCLRWYDGDPTNGNPTNPTYTSGKGWVNFCPPLSKNAFSISDLPLDIYYLVGARQIVPFKDRLLFLGPVVQTSSAGSQVYLQDTIIYSLNGPPYYTASFTGDPSLPTTTFHPILVPTNQTATPTAYWGDQAGFGGFIAAGLAQPIITVSSNEDVLIVGFSGNFQTRVIYSGNDLLPFQFYLINAELPSGSTFSAINMDQGVITRGQRGYIITGQTQAQRIDLDIPDQVFEINLTNNGNERFTAQRDFINEWIYFTYPSNQTSNIFNNQTLQYNYRDQSWAIFYESYTTYGQFRAQTGFTWNTVGSFYPTWTAWNDPWDSGESTLLQTQVIAGNQQGYVIFRGIGTGEAPSLSIQSIVGNTLTSPNHNLNEGDYIIITGAQGSIAATVNNQIFSVQTPTTNTFLLDGPIVSGTYTGGGQITRLYVPFIQTKQFPVAWDLARKTRLGPQQYLFTRTDLGKVTLFIYLSQSGNVPSNDSPIVPDPASINDALIYNTTLYTCPESTNLGLTPANASLQMIQDVTTGTSQQEQIWHRINTSLIGDTIQVAITMNDVQMREIIVVNDVNFFPNQMAEIELHNMILDVNPSALLA